MEDEGGEIRGIRGTKMEEERGEIRRFLQSRVFSIEGFLELEYLRFFETRKPKEMLF